MTKILDGVLVLVVNFFLNVEVNGSVWRQTIIPLSTPIAQMTEKLYPREPNQPDWAKIIFIKNLLELECLRDNYKRIQRDRLQYNSQSKIPIHTEKEFSKRPSSDRNENENLKRRRYFGEDEKIILTPMRQGESGFPIYIYNRPQSPNPDHVKYLHKEIRTQGTSPKARLNETLNKNNKDESLKSASRQPSNSDKDGIKTREPTLLNNSESKVNNQIFDGSSKNTSKVSAEIFKAPAKKLLPAENFFQFMEKIQSLSSPSVKNASMGSQTLSSHAVKEISKESIRKDSAKDDTLTEIRKPQHTVGGYHFSSETTNKPKHPEPLEILQNSIAQILKGLLGTKEDETEEKENKNFSKTPKAQTGFPLSKITTLEGTQNLDRQKFIGKNTQPYPFDYPERRRYFSKIQTSTERPFYPEFLANAAQNSPQQYEQHQLISASSDMFNINKPILDSQRLTEHEKSVKTSIYSPATFTPKNYLSNNSSLTTKAMGRQLKFPEVDSFLLDVFNNSTELSSEANKNISPKWTTPALILSEQFKQPQETTLTNSVFSDSKAFANILVEHSTSTPQNALNNSNSFLQELSVSTSEYPSYVKTTSPSSSAPDVNSNSITTGYVESEKSQKVDGSTVAASTPTQFTEGPVAFDLLLRTHDEPDMKDQESQTQAWTNGKKMNLDGDSKISEITNLLFNATEQRRSDILINDAPEDYDQSQLEMKPFGYMKKLKEILLTSDFTIDDIVFILPSVVDDLRQNKIQAEDMEFLSKAFGKYWQDILALSKDLNLDMLPLVKVAKEKDLKKLLDNFLPKDNSEMTTMESTIEITEEKTVDVPAYDYLEEYQDFYKNIVGQTLEKRKKKRLRPKREKSLVSLMAELMSDITENNRPIARTERDADEDMLKIEATKEYFEALEEENSQIQNEDKNYIYEDIIYDELSEILGSSDFSVEESKKLTDELLGNRNNNNKRK